MREKENRKEILTYANIRRDLRRRLWMHWVNAIVVVLVSIMLVGLLWIDPEFLFETSPRYHLQGWMYFLIYPVLVYLLNKDAWLVSCGFRRRPYIVKDKLISSDGGSDYASSGWHTSSWGVLHFNCYGDYNIPSTNHPWSKENKMTSEGVCHTSFDGNEFYLVLSRPHNGKILLAYNTELFQLETETDTPK